MQTSQPTAPSRTAVLLAVFAVYLIWGSTYLGIRFAIQSIPPFLMAGSRYFIAGAIMYLFARIKGVKAPSLKEWRDATIVGGCLLLGGNGGITFAVQYLPTGFTALLVATVPIFLTIFGWLSRLSPKPSFPVTFALILGLSGVAMLSGSALDHSAPLGGVQIFGVAIVLFAAAIWAAGSLYSRGACRPLSSILGVGMQMLCGGLLMCMAGWLSGEPSRLNLGLISSKSWLAFAYLVVFGSIFGFTAYIWLVRVCQPAFVGTYAFVNPIVAVLLGWAFAGEKISLQIVEGAVIILISVAIIVLFPLPSVVLPGTRKRCRSVDK